MDWEALPSDAERRALAQALVGISSERGWSRRSLEIASVAALGDPERWRAVFPRGAVQAIWFISEVSDTSMAAAFAASPAARMAEVIRERLDQNRDLKRFVRRVMLFDFAHPVQALRRMQRTARVMAGCLPAAPRRLGRVRLALLNLFYTAVVFRWLFDRSERDRASHRLAARLMRILRL